MSGTAARHSHIGAVRFTRRVASQAAVSSSPTGPSWPAAAGGVVHQHGEPTEASRRALDQVVARGLVDEVGGDELGVAVRGSPAFRAAAATASPRAGSRPVTSTRAPCAANSTAIARPMPAVEPVTTAISPWSRTRRNVHRCPMTDRGGGPDF